LMFVIVEVLEAHLLERDWRTCQVLRKALPLLRASARQQDGGVNTESRVSPPEKVIRHVLVDKLAVEKKLDYTPAEALGHLLEVAEWAMDEIALLVKAALQHDGVPMRIPPPEVAEGLELEFILHLV